MENANEYTPRVEPETYTAADMAKVLAAVDELAAKVSALEKRYANERARLHEKINTLLPDDQQLPVSVPAAPSVVQPSGGSVGRKVRNLIAGL
jgi:hypothetical protein